MTMIVAWRDPFCLVADSRESGAFERRSDVGSKKIAHISYDVVIGLAGPGSALDGIVLEVRRVLPTVGWRDLEAATQNIVGDLNDRTDHLEKMVTVVIAGTIDGRPGLFDSGPCAVARAPGDSALEQPCAFAGSGGILANAAHAIASMWRPEVRGEELLIAIVEAAVRGDASHTKKPIWRVDLGAGVIAPAYEWLYELPDEVPLIRRPT
jgi:hypothetical protein